MASLGTREATNRSPGPIGAVASTTRQTTSTSPMAPVAESLSRSPSRVRGLWMPGVSSNTICVSAVLSTPRTCVRVVCGLSETMLTLVPRMVLSSVDFPTLGRPTMVTNPDLMTGPSWSRHLVVLVLVLVVVGLAGHDALDAHPADAAAGHPLGPQDQALALDLLALGRHVAEQVEHQPADGVPVALGQLAVEQVVDLVDRHGPVDPHVAAGQALDGGLVAVVLVEDLPDQLLEQVLQGDETRGAAVLVDHHRQVDLAGLHL